MPIPALPLNPAIDLPGPFVIPDPILELPYALVPEYEPLPPYIDPGEAEEMTPSPVKVNSEEEEPEETKEEKPEKKVTKEEVIPQNLLDKVNEITKSGPVLPPLPQINIPIPEAEVETPKEVVTVQIPGTDIDLPVPTPEIMSAAAVTSVISVGATLAATNVFKHMVSVFKPIIQQVVKRIQKILGKEPKSWARQRLELRRNKSHRMGNQV